MAESEAKRARVMLSMRVAPDSLTKIDELAARYRITRAEVIRTMMRHGLEPTRAELKRRFQ